MKRFTSLLFALALLAFFVVPAAASAPASATSIPTISIVSVTADQSVTIQTHNFPANDTFSVLMNYMGTRGVNGIKVTTIDSGSGGSFTVTFDIPQSLKGQRQIAIRLQSSASGYFAYNWFYNNTAGSNTGGGTVPGGGYSGFPTFSIQSVQAGESVTIVTKNFPANDTFNVLMGKMGTRGVNGTKVTSVSSGSGGSFTKTFQIPAALKDDYRIAIRLQSPTSGYFAYNWFYNNTTGSGTGGGTVPGGGYTGFPTFSIASVVRNTSVTVNAKNLPASDTFKVYMGPMGTRGINGYLVTSVNSGSGGTASYTFNIPSQLANSYRISIRMQSPTSGYFAYNWFYNTNAP